MAAVDRYLQCDGALHGGRQAVGFSQDMQDARHRGQGVERRLRRVRWPVPIGGLPEGLEVAGSRACFCASSSASRSPAAITALTGCCSMAQAAISATTQALMIASGAPWVVRESRMVSSRRCPAAVIGVAQPNGRARMAAPMLLPSVACSSPVATKRRTAAWVVGPAPRIPGSAFASRPRKSRRRPARSPRPDTPRPAAAARCHPRSRPGASPSCRERLQRLPTHLLWRPSSQGTPSASPAAYATIPARMCCGVGATPPGNVGPTTHHLRSWTGLGTAEISMTPDGDQLASASSRSCTSWTNASLRQR